MANSASKTTFGKALIPVLFLLLLLVYGLIIRPKFFQDTPLSLEFIFLLGCVFSILYLIFLGHKWDDIQASAVEKISKAMPTLLILLAIGMIIGSWIICGTIPMLVYYGIKLIHPDYIYLIAFVVPVIFSTITGTSWGSISTVGVVLMGVASAINADLAITAGAVIGGSFFGDKLSPLSDTTNVAAAAVDIKVTEHIQSMLYTTIPSAIIACIFFAIMGFVFPATSSTHDFAIINSTLYDIKQLFNFNVLLLIPPLIILYGSIRKKATLPLLVISAFSAIILAFVFQSYSFTQITSTLFTGFSTEMNPLVQVSQEVRDLFNRGGLYSFKEPVIITILIFIFVGTIDRINAMSIIVNRLFGFVKSNGALVRASLISTGITNAMTSNQYATSFIIGDAFKRKFDEAGIHRKVLSRSLEDMGTMLESLVPWHTTCIFIVGTLGVAVADYWYWQVFSLANFIVAFIFASLGIAIFKRKAE